MGERKRGIRTAHTQLSYAPGRRDQLTFWGDVLFKRGNKIIMALVVYKRGRDSAISTRRSGLVHGHSVDEEMGD